MRRKLNAVLAHVAIDDGGALHTLSVIPRTMSRSARLRILKALPK